MSLTTKSDSILARMTAQWAAKAARKYSKEGSANSLLQLPVTLTHAVSPCDTSVFLFGDVHSGQNAIFDLLTSNMHAVEAGANQLGDLHSQGIAYSFFTTKHDISVNLLTQALREADLLTMDDIDTLGKDGKAVRTVHVYSFEGRPDTEPTLSAIKTAVASNADKSYQHLQQVLRELPAGSLTEPICRELPATALAWGLQHTVLIHVLDASKPITIPKQQRDYYAIMSKIAEGLMDAVGDGASHLRDLLRVRLQHSASEAPDASSTPNYYTNIAEMVNMLPQLREGELCVNHGIPFLTAVTYAERLCGTESAAAHSIPSTFLQITSISHHDSRSLYESLAVKGSTERALQGLESLTQKPKETVALPFTEAFENFHKNVKNCFATPLSDENAELLFASIRACALYYGASVLSVPLMTTGEGMGDRFAQIGQLFSFLTGGAATLLHSISAKDAASPLDTVTRMLPRHMAVIPCGNDSNELIADSMLAGKLGSRDAAELSAIGINPSGDTIMQQALIDLTVQKASDIIGTALPEYPACVPNSRAYDVSQMPDFATDFRDCGPSYAYFAWNPAQNPSVLSTFADQLRHPAVVALSYIEEGAPTMAEALAVMHAQQEKMIAASASAATAADTSSAAALRRMASAPVMKGKESASADSLAVKASAADSTAAAPTPQATKAPAAFFAQLARSGNIAAKK